MSRLGDYVFVCFTLYMLCYLLDTDICVYIIIIGFCDVNIPHRAIT